MWRVMSLPCPPDQSERDASSQCTMFLWTNQNPTELFTCLADQPQHNVTKRPSGWNTCIQLQIVSFTCRESKTTRTDQISRGREWNGAHRPSQSRIGKRADRNAAPQSFRCQKPALRGACAKVIPFLRPLSTSASDLPNNRHPQPKLRGKISGLCEERM